MAFIIMDYIEGKMLSELGFQKGVEWGITWTQTVRYVYERLADVYIQLGSLEFPGIGALGLPAQHTGSLLTCDLDDIRVCHRPLSIEMVMQEAEGMEPGSMIKPKTTFETARSFVDALFWLADNELDKSLDTLMDERGGRGTLYARDSFRRYVADTWLDPGADKDPFVLMHGDLTLLTNNALFGRDHKLLAFSIRNGIYLVPAQLLVPPVWLTSSDFDFMLMGQKWYNAEVRHLVNVIENREEVLQIPPTLSQEWTKMTTWCHTAVAVVLLNLDMIYNTFCDFLLYELVAPALKPEGFREYYKRYVSSRLEAFMESSDARRVFLARKE
ncbi:hypothetical protein AAE478_006083 [Parahypoxylon ruwenzoriense]